MFDSIKNIFNRGDSRKAEMSKLEAEASQFKLPSEWFPQACKILFFIGLAFLNYRLFAEVVPGAWGTATGIVAMLSEALAVYCSHYFSRAAGWFRLSLGLCGCLLMIFALIHGTFSIFDLIGVWEFGEDIEFYSRVVAFPLLAGLIGLTVLALTMTHPNNIVRLKEALAHTRIAVGRAEAASDVRLMRTRSVIDDARLEHQREKTRRESEYLTELREYVSIEQEKRRLVQGIPDPDLRQALAREMGITDPGHYEDPPRNRPGFVTQGEDDSRPKGQSTQD